MGLGRIPISSPNPLYRPKDLEKIQLSPGLYIGCGSTFIMISRNM